MSHTNIGPRYAANLSILFPELPLNKRAAAAAAAGFQYVESWWPFDRPDPTPAELDSFCDSLVCAGVKLVLLNLTAGSSSESDRGILTDASAEDEFRDNVNAVVEILSRTGCRVVHALFGNRHDPQLAETEDQLALERIVILAGRIASLGATVVLETLNPFSNPDYPLVNIERTAEVVTEAREHSADGNIAMLFDTYHLAMLGLDPVESAHRYASLIGHVQFADAPGRGKPGTGSINFEAVLGALNEHGYEGFIGLEYDPAYLDAAHSVDNTDAAEPESPQPDLPNTTSYTRVKETS